MCDKQKLHEGKKVARLRACKQQCTYQCVKVCFFTQASYRPSLGVNQRASMLSFTFDYCLHWSIQTES